SKEQYNEEAKDSAPKTWPIDQSKSVACIETLQRELIDKNATIASLQQIQSDAADLYFVRLSMNPWSDCYRVRLSEQYKTNAEQQTNLDQMHAELIESKIATAAIPTTCQRHHAELANSIANLEADLSQEQSHNSVLEFEMNDMFAKEKLMKTRDDKIAAMDFAERTIH
ncbi:hypothetical protein HDU80_001664, partial [Chytriomyces hyalinus]